MLITTVVPYFATAEHHIVEAPLSELATCRYVCDSFRVYNLYAKLLTGHSPSKSIAGSSVYLRFSTGTDEVGAKANKS